MQAKDVQPEKAPAPMLFMLFGRMMLVNVLQ